MSDKNEQVIEMTKKFNELNNKYEEIKIQHEKLVSKTKMESERL